MRQLATLSLEYKEAFLSNSTMWSLGNLVRCVLEAGVSPDSRTGHLFRPVLLVAAGKGALPAVKALLAVRTSSWRTTRKASLLSTLLLSMDACLVCSSSSPPGRTQTRKASWELHR